MLLGEVTRDALDTLRAHAQSEMDCDVTIYTHRRYEFVDGSEVEMFGPEVYAGVGAVDPGSMAGQVTSTGQQPVTSRAYRCSVPWWVHALREGHVMVVNHCPRDPSLDGARFTVETVRQNGLGVVKRRFTASVIETP
ncbi:DUF6093 family protein [Segatella copri]|uniref:DUF6093 family protein n=1 Tax=Segatella copri TaxID=165179 RepID=UPI003F897A6E